MHPTPYADTRLVEMIDRLNQAFSGRYSVQRELGRGGMATVFLAEPQDRFEG